MHRVDGGPPLVNAAPSKYLPIMLRSLPARVLLCVMALILALSPLVHAGARAASNVGVSSQGAAGPVAVMIHHHASGQTILSEGRGESAETRQAGDHTGGGISCCMTAMCELAVSPPETVLRPCHLPPARPWIAVGNLPLMACATRIERPPQG